MRKSDIAAPNLTPYMNRESVSPRAPDASRQIFSLCEPSRLHSCWLTVRL